MVEHGGRTPLASGAIPSPNIWYYPDLYELQNEAIDRDGTIEAALRAIADWAGRDVLDIGCGTGYHLPRFATAPGAAASVTGIEPHPELAHRARRRIADLPPVPPARVLEAGAAALPLPDASIDLAHARWAYFFGPGCEPGLAELDRVIRPGGLAYIVDIDATDSTFGAWFRGAYPNYDPVAVERFWRRQGWERRRLTFRWEYATRADFEAVVGIEFPPEAAGRILAQHPRVRGVDYAVNLWWRQF